MAKGSATCEAKAVPSPVNAPLRMLNAVSISQVFKMQNYDLGFWLPVFGKCSLKQHNYIRQQKQRRSKVQVATQMA